MYARCLYAGGLYAGGLYAGGLYAGGLKPGSLMWDFVVYPYQRNSISIDLSVCFVSQGRPKISSWYK